MFNVIHSLAPNGLHYQPFSEDAYDRKTEMEKRRKIVENFVKDLGLSAGVDREKIDTLEVMPSRTTFGFAVGEAFRKEGRDVMEIPVHCFLDLGRDFQIHNFQDLEDKLQDPRWMYNTIRIVETIMGATFSEFDEASTEAFKRVLRTNIQYLMDSPDKAFDADRYIILHEFGHIQNEDAFRLNLKHVLKNLPFVIFASLLFLLTTGTLYLASGSTLASIAAMSPVAIASLVTSSLVALVVSTVATLILINHVCRKREVAADCFAAGAFFGLGREKIQRGGIYFFESFMKFNASEPPTDASCLSTFKEFVFNSHPSHIDRIEMLKNFEWLNLRVEPS